MASIVKSKQSVRSVRSSRKEAWTDVSQPIIDEEVDPNNVDADGEESYYDEEEESETEYYDTEEDISKLEGHAKVGPSDNNAGPSDKLGPSDKPGPSDKQVVGSGEDVKRARE